MTVGTCDVTGHNVEGKWARQVLQPSWPGTEPVHSDQQHFVLPLCLQASGEHQKQPALIYGSKKAPQANVIARFSCSFISHPCPALSLADGLMLEGKKTTKNRDAACYQLTVPPPCRSDAGRCPAPIPQYGKAAPHTRSASSRQRAAHFRFAPYHGRAAHGLIGSPA